MRDAYFDENELTALTDCLRGLVWAAGRLQVAQQELLELLEASNSSIHFRPVRIEALTAIGQVDLPKQADTILEKLAQSGDPELRTLAADILGKQRKKLAEALAKDLLSDRVSFNRMVSNEGIDVKPTLLNAAEGNTLSRCRLTASHCRR